MEKEEPSWQEIEEKFGDVPRKVYPVLDDQDGDLDALVDQFFGPLNLE